MTSQKKIAYPKVTCARCGTCCCVPLVPITHKDLVRLVKATGKRADEIVRFSPSSEMSYDSDAGLWIRFKSGRRAMVLRKRRGGCLFQTAEHACAVYASRPQTCRSFPYSVEFEDAGGKEVSEITLNDILPCKAQKCSGIDIDLLLDNVRKENREDAEYHRLIKKWNDSKSTGGVAEFLRFIGF